MLSRTDDNNLFGLQQIDNKENLIMTNNEVIIRFINLDNLEVFLRNLLRLYIRRTGSNSKCISSDNYTSAVKKELQQLSTFSQIKEIRDKELNSVILSHLEMSEDLVEGIKSEWEQKKIFKKQIKGDDGTTLIEDRYCTRSYVREIILRYCQNRTFFRTKFNIKDGNLF